MKAKGAEEESEINSRRNAAVLQPGMRGVRATRLFDQIDHTALLLPCGCCCGGAHCVPPGAMLRLLRLLHSGNNIGSAALPAGAAALHQLSASRIFASKLIGRKLTPSASAAAGGDCFCGCCRGGVGRGNGAGKLNFCNF